MKSGRVAAVGAQGEDATHSSCCSIWCWLDALLQLEVWFNATGVVTLLGPHMRSSLQHGCAYQVLKQDSHNQLGFSCCNALAVHLSTLTAHFYASCQQQG